MRKLSALIMCVLLMALLTACGDKDDSSTSSSGEHIGNLQAMESPTDDALGWGNFEIVE